MAYEKKIISARDTIALMKSAELAWNRANNAFGKLYNTDNEHTYPNYNIDKLKDKGPVPRLMCDLLRSGSNSITVVHRHYNRAGILDTNSQEVTLHLQTLINEIGSLKHFFVDKSVFEETTCIDVKSKIENFLEIAKNFGFEPKQSARSTSKPN